LNRLHGHVTIDPPDWPAVTSTIERKSIKKRFLARASRMKQQKIKSLLIRPTMATLILAQRITQSTIPRR
jgi:hypothetical protein